MRSRRALLQQLSAFAGVGLASSLLNPKALAKGAQDPRFLIVLCATGGGSIIDGPLVVKRSESATPDALNTFPDDVVKEWQGSPFRAADLSMNSIGAIPAPFSTRPSAVLERHRAELMVATLTGTSVNHQIAERRSITGNEAFRGRTLQELVAWQYGAEVPIPNVHLLTGTGFNDSGTDATVPAWARRQVVSDPAIWPLSLHGTKGLERGLPADVLHSVRKIREQQFEPATRFAQIYGESPRLAEWARLRGAPQDRIEAMGLIEKLMVSEESPELPLSKFGLRSSGSAAAARAAFPNTATDRLHAQAALAFLLLKHGVSVSVTLGPDFGFSYAPGVSEGAGLPPDSVLNPPLGFDFSHQAHRAGQAVVWSRIYAVVDGLIGLLKAEPFAGGGSMWDRTLIYVATEFGRTKTRPAGAEDWGTGHDLNNGVAVFSPLVPGDTLRGGVDPDTCLTYGFDPETGDPDPGRSTAEAEVFSGLLGALGVDREDSGLPDVPALRRA
jgi:hypothetical protein